MKGSRQSKITGSVRKGECLICREETETLSFYNGWYYLCNNHTYKEMVNTLNKPNEATDTDLD